MKTLITFLSLTFCLSTFTFAQSIDFGNVFRIDCGSVSKGASEVREFKFTNKGTAPLTVEASGGGAVITYPQKPVMPGESNSIKVEYKANNLGSFSIPILVTTNDPEKEEVMLRFLGKVIDAPAAPKVNNN